ncbi:MAG: hypothetical protein JXA68_01650 [Ignavibacteriales bacterium]|nr:hypothetical protein [Ignavibacteriales bacterium]
MEDLLKSNDKKRDGLKEFIIKIAPLIKTIYQAKWKIILANFIIAIIVLVYLFFLTKPYYDSSVSILPEYGNKSSTFSQLSSLASMAGINIGDVSPTAIYENLIYSETVVSNVVFRKYKTTEFKDSINLIEYFEIEVDDDLPKEEANRYLFIKAYQKIKNLITTNLDRLTNVLTITVRMPESKLSSEVVNQFVISLDDYIRTQRKSFATEQVKFIENRVIEVADSLRDSEEKLKKFRELNRVTIQSPQLMLEQSRLLRNLEILQTVYIELTKQLELARIDQVKDTPVLNVKEYAGNPILKTGPQRIVTFVLLMMLSFVISCLYFIYNGKIKEIRQLIVKSLKNKN